MTRATRGHITRSTDMLQRKNIHAQTCPFGILIESTMSRRRIRAGNTMVYVKDRLPCLRGIFAGFCETANSTTCHCSCKASDAPTAWIYVTSCPYRCHRQSDTLCTHLDTHDIHEASAIACFRHMFARHSNSSAILTISQNLRTSSIPRIWCCLPARMLSLYHHRLLLKPRPVVTARTI